METRIPMHPDPHVSPNPSLDTLAMIFSGTSPCPALGSNCIPRHTLHMGGRQQTVLMRPTPQSCVKTRGRGGGGEGLGGVRFGDIGGGFRPWGGFPRWGGLRTTHYYHMHTSWGCVFGGYGVRRYVRDNSAFSIWPEESLKGRRVAPLPASPFPLRACPPPPPPAPRLVCEKNSWGLVRVAG